MATSFELVLRPVIDLAASVGDRRVVATGVGDGDRLVALLGSVTPGAPVDPSEPFIPGGEHDPRVLLMSALFADGQSKSVVELQVEPFTLAFPVVQPLSDGGLLVADSRVAVGKPPNGYVIGPDGKVRHSIMFGDGIEHLLVDRVGRVWVGYFDEGVFGNLGRGNPGSPEPIGSPGLLRFDLATGEIEWAFKLPEGSDSIADCYALNVDGDHAWMSYHTDFDLFRVDSDGGTRRWRVGARGPGAVACDGRQALLVGGYDSRMSATLWNLGDDRLTDPKPVRLQLEGDSLNPDAMWGRGPALHAVRGSTWYLAELGDITGEGQRVEISDTTATWQDQVTHRHNQRPSCLPRRGRPRCWRVRASVCPQDAARANICSTTAETVHSIHSSCDHPRPSTSAW